MSAAMQLGMVAILQRKHGDTTTRASHCLRFKFFNVNALHCGALRKP